MIAAMDDFMGTASRGRLVDEPSPGQRLPHELSSLEWIIGLVALSAKVSVTAIKSKRRTAEVVRARHAFWYLARHLTTFTLEEIAEFSGASDHTTVLYGLDKVREDQELAKRLLEDARKAFGLVAS